jgi:thioredoxin-like negative regulator of GroEL
MVLDLVYIYMDGCGPCDAMYPVIEEFNSSRPDVSVYKFPFLSEEQVVVELKKEFGIESIPFFIAYADGNLLSSRLGYATAAELSAMFDHQQAVEAV